MNAWDAVYLRDASAPNGGKLSQDADVALQRETSRLDSYAARHEGGRGMAIGAEGIKYRISSDAIRAMRDSLNTGATLREAVAFAKGEARKMVSVHNSRRPKDISWQRADMLADAAIEHAARLVAETAEA